MRAGLSGIYRIVHLSTGREYIGSSADIASRWREHHWELAHRRHHSRFLMRCWRKYGEDAFRFEVLEYVPDLTRLIPTEQRYLDLRQPAFNTCKVAGSTLGIRISAEIRQRWSQMKKGKFPEALRPFIEASRGKPATEAMLRGLRIGWGMSHPFKMTPNRAAFYHRRKGTPAHPNSLRGLEYGRGRKLTPEEHQALIKASADARRGKPLSEEHRRKIGRFHKGRQYAETQLRGLRGCHEERRGQPMTETTLQHLLDAWERRRQEGRTARRPVDGETPKYLLKKAANAERILAVLAIHGCGTTLPTTANQWSKLYAQEVGVCGPVVYRDLKVMIYQGLVTETFATPPTPSPAQEATHE